MKNSPIKDTTVRMIEVTTKLHDNEGNEYINLELVQKVLNERTRIREYAYIVHDKDTYSEEDAGEDHEIGDLKAPHIHIMMRFSQPQHLLCIPKWFGLKDNCTRKIKKWEPALKYLIHQDYPEKYQYKVDEVTANFNYQAFLENSKRERELDQVVPKILSGEIREYNKTEEIDNELLVYKARQIEQAFKVRQEYLEATAQERHTECIFITGPSQSGKTTLAKKIAEGKGLKYFVASGSNDPLFNYKQQPAVILDELRPDWIGFSDLLKMLDNHTASTAKARYRNVYLQCELIIITTIYDIDYFCQATFNGKEEPAVQLKRRCGTYIRMDAKRLYISKWDAKEMCYSEPLEYVNNLLDDYIPDKELTKEDVETHISDLIPFLKRPGESQRRDGFTECGEEDTPFYQQRFLTTEPDGGMKDAE